MPGIEVLLSNTTDFDARFKSYRHLTGFVSGSVDLSMDSIARSFSLQIAKEGPVNPSDMPKGQQYCAILVDGEQVLRGTVEVGSVSYDNSSHTISISGRSITADIVDSSFLRSVVFQNDISLRRIIRRVILEIQRTVPNTDSGKQRDPFQRPRSLVGKPTVPDKIELAYIDIIDETGITDFKLGEQNHILVLPGDNCFDFIEKLARIKRVLLTTDNNGNIVISKGTPAEINAYAVLGKNAVAGNFQFDYSNTFNTVGVIATFDPQADVGNKGTSSTVPLPSEEATYDDLSVAVASHDALRKGRTLCVSAEEITTYDYAIDRAVAELDIRRTRAKVHGMTVQGFRNQTGQLWSPNTNIYVEDEFAGIAERMLLNTVSFKYDASTGSTTQLGFVPLDSYNLTLNSPGVAEREAIGLGIAISEVE